MIAETISLHLLATHFFANLKNDGKKMGGKKKIGRKNS